MRGYPANLSGDLMQGLPGPAHLPAADPGAHPVHARTDQGEEQVPRQLIYETKEEVSKKLRNKMVILNGLYCGVTLTTSAVYQLYTVNVFFCFF